MIVWVQKGNQGMYSFAGCRGFCTTTLRMGNLLFQDSFKRSFLLTESEFISYPWYYLDCADKQKSESDGVFPFACVQWEQILTGINIVRTTDISRPRSISLSSISPVSIILLMYSCKTELSTCARLCEPLPVLAVPPDNDTNGL